MTTARSAPDPGGFSDSRQLADAMEAYLKTVPLGGAKQRVTQEVEQWATASGRSTSSPELLDAYNAEAATARSELERAFRQFVPSPVGKRALIALLGRAGVFDDVRLAALDVLAGVVDANDAAELARINTGQRPHVMGKALDVIAATHCATALFALGKVYSQREESRERAIRLAGELARDLPEPRALRSLGDGQRTFSTASGLNPAELLLAALSLTAAEQRRILGSPDVGQVADPLRSGVGALDDALRSETDRSGSLGRYHTRLRDELHEFVLVTGLGTKELESRALDNVFRRDDLDHVEALLAVVPDESVQIYAERALTRTNRRNRPDRAVAALHAIGDRAEVGARLTDAVRDCLAETEEAVRLSAALVLSRRQDDLDQGAQAQLLEVYEGLSHESQLALAEELDLPPLEGHGRGTSPQALSNWVAASSSEDLSRRLGHVLALWPITFDSDEQARDAIVTVGPLLDRLDSPQRDVFVDRLCDATAQWLRSRTGRTRTRESVSALFAWSPFRRLMVERFGRFAEILLADQARTLLGLALSPAEGLDSPTLLSAASLSLGDDREERLIVPVLASAVEGSPSQAREAFASADAGAKERLAMAALHTIESTTRRIERLGEAKRSGATEALLARQETLLAALGEAEEAATGNERLLELFTAVRCAVGGDKAPATVATPDGPPVPEAVRRWRLSAAGKYQGLVGAPSDGRQLVTEAADFRDRSEEVANLLLELDKRANSTRVAPAKDREHYQRDLEGALDAAIESGLLDAAAAAAGEDPIAAALQRRRTTLGDLAWSRWAARGQEHGVPEGLGVALAGVAAGAEHAEATFDRQLADATTDTLRRAVRSLSESELEAVWTFLVRRLDTASRRARQLDREVKSQGAKAGREIAERLDLPFKLIEGLLFSYFRLRTRLSDAGWRQVETTLGRRLARDQLDPAQHQVEGDTDAHWFEVRSLGIRVDRQVVKKAVVTGVARDGSVQGEPDQEEG